MNENCITVLSFSILFYADKEVEDKKAKKNNKDLCNPAREQTQECNRYKIMKLFYTGAFTAKRKQIKG